MDNELYDLYAKLTLTEQEEEELQVDSRLIENVLRESPWNFNKQLVPLQEFDGRQQVHQVRMHEASFWVRIIDLPLMARNHYVRNLVGSVIAIVKEINLEVDELEWGEFMQVRVCLDITKLLLRRKKINVGLDFPCWIRFQ